MRTALISNLDIEVDGSIVAASFVCGYPFQILAFLSGPSSDNKQSYEYITDFAYMPDNAADDCVPVPVYFKENSMYYIRGFLIRVDNTAEVDYALRNPT